jgi:hypothetical protein
VRTLRKALLATIVAAVAIPVALAFAQTSTVPTVNSAAATGVSNSSATFNGTVNPNATATQYAFQYGPTANYGQETPLTSAGSGTSAASVSAAETDLAPGTTYHFRIIAINVGGTAVGSDQSFTTTGTAPAPSTSPTASTGSSSGVGQSGATVGGTVNPQGQATEYYFEYGPTANYGYETNAQLAAAGSGSISVSATLAGLDPGTIYHYRLVAASPGGVALGSDGTFTTTNPPVVASASATSVTSDSAVLNGTVNPNGRTSTYYFQYGTTTDYGLQTPPASAGAGTSQVAVNSEVAGLMPNTTYHFRLVSTSSAGTTYGTDVTVTTLGTTLPASTVKLMGHMGFVSPGQVIGVEVGCFGESPCAGTFTMTVSGKVIGQGNFKQNANTGGFQNIKLNATGQSDMKGNKVNHLLVTDVTVKTTAGQTIDGRLSLADWSWKDLQ